jgi:membrane carboxypeptidase/penicillin-binding protein
MLEINPKLKKTIFIALCAIALVAIISGIYVFTVYLEFLSNKNSIFSKIEDFSKSLDKNKETRITLGLDVTSDSEKEASVILDRNGKIIAKYTTDKHKLIPLKEIPYFLTKGFILIEDKDFYSHGGFNAVRLVKAFFANMVTFGHSPGGSTISQQLAKILFTKQDRSTKRKIYELFCTMELEKRFTKNEIIQIYLNSIYLGHGVYGIENAASFYFGKDANDLNIAEAALLIGMNRSPENYSPIKNKTNAANIQKVVMSQFVKSGFMSKETSEQEIKRFWKKYDEMEASGNQSFWKTEVNNSGYITEYVRQILEKELSYETITQGGLVIETTIDLEKQSMAEKIVKDDLKSIRNDLKNLSVKYKMNYSDDVIKKMEGALVSLDYKTGELLVLVGGSGYSFANQFNRAVNAHRPIGSSVKPFIYSAALNAKKIKDKDVHPFSKFNDEEITFTVNGKKYTPKNFHADKHYGMVSLYDAIRMSLNTIAVQVLNQMDIKEVSDFIKKATLLTDEPGSKRIPEVLSLALGTCELSPLELATGYAVFPRGGKTVYPYVIRKISDTKGNVFYDMALDNNQYFNSLYPEKYKTPEQIITPEVTYEMTEMLRSVFEKGGTAAWSAAVTGFNGAAYGKSGTTQDFKDGWFAGFTDREVTTTWVGIDTNESILQASEGNATLIWCDYIKQNSYNISEAINIPDNMKLIPMDMDTGLAATKNCPAASVKDFYFWKDGPFPEECYIHKSHDLQDGDIK